MLSTGGLIYKSLGSNKAMWTEAFLEDDGRCHGYTRTATFTWFGGFTGGLVVLVLDPDSRLLAQTPLQSFGVDGRWIGSSDRTDSWEFALAPEPLASAVCLLPVQDWNLPYCFPISGWEVGRILPAALLTLIGGQRVTDAAAPIVAGR